MNTMFLQAIDINFNCEQLQR